MKAANLTITVPYQGCDKNCPYCISQITGMVESDIGQMYRNVPKVKTLAKAAGVTTVLITSKGEPMLNPDATFVFAQQFSEWPLEIQTNGIWLRNHPDALKMLKQSGVDTIAISIDMPCDFSATVPLLEHINKLNMTSRLTVNVTNWMVYSFDLILDYCVKYKVNQLLFRLISIPNDAPETIQTKWITENVDTLRWRQFEDDMNEAITSPIATTPFGYKIYDVKGVGVVMNDYCIQDAHNHDDIRSLIFTEDGHVCTSWMSPGSRLF